ncbi:MAG: hypothetical protein MUE41_09660 [Gemmatimonadaceae bacterium]|nr:hypothetical protein [Gemmatimonadaceae bacterium]
MMRGRMVVMVVVLAVLPGARAQAQPPATAAIDARLAATPKAKGGTARATTGARRVVSSGVAGSAAAAMRASAPPRAVREGSDDARQAPPPPSRRPASGTKSPRP